MSYLRDSDWSRYVLRTRVFMARMYPHLYFVNGVCPDISDERLSDLLATFTGVRFRIVNRSASVTPVVSIPLLEEKIDFRKISRPSVSANVKQTRYRTGTLRKDLPTHNAQKKEMNRVRKQSKKSKTKNRAYDRDCKTELQQASYLEEPGYWDYPDYDDYDDEYDPNFCYCCDRAYRRCRCNDYYDDYYDNYDWDHDDHYDYYDDYDYGNPFGYWY